MKKIFPLAAAIIFSVNVFSQPVIQWQKTLGGTKNEWEPIAIQPTSDGGYIAGGNTYSTDGNITGHHGDTAHADCWIAKLDGSGSIQWQKSLGGTNDEQFGYIEPTSDGGYIVAATTWSNDGDVTGMHGIDDYWIVKLDGSGNIQWQKCLGGTNGDNAYCIRQTSDGGYVVAGSSTSNDVDVTVNNGWADYWIVKLSSSGTIQWQKSFGGTNHDLAYSVEQTTDGGYAIAGYTYSTDGDVTGNHGMTDTWIIKLDGSGNVQWKKCIGGTDNDQVFSIHQTYDSGYILGGWTGSNDGDVTGNHSGAWDYWAVKLDGSGSIQWQKCFGGTLSEIGNDIIQAANGDYIMGGSAYSYDGDVTGNHSNFGDYWVVRLDGSGNMLWQKCVGGSDTELGCSIREATDGGLVIAGSTRSNDFDVTGNHGGSDLWVVKLTPYVGVEENHGEENYFSVSPNPAANEIIIQNAEFGIESVEIFDVLGQKYNSAFNHSLLTIDVSSLAPGIYFVKVRGEKEERVAKFVKQ